MKISCAFAPSSSTPTHVALAEQLGYERAWLYDSPALYTDVWVTMALAAERTSTIGLGPGVMVPSLRHVMTNAAAIATIADLAPGRLSVAVGSGFTGARCLGRKPMKWADVADYVRALKALLRGDEIELDGFALRMMHPEGFAPPRPIEVEVLIAAAGPKGTAVAKEVGDGVFLAGVPNGAADFERASMLTFGTVLRDGETLESERVIATAGTGAAVVLHGMYEWSPEFLDAMPGGAEWKATIETFPERSRHLAVHEGHLVHLTERDRPYVGELLGGYAFTPSELRERLATFEAAGVTELAYQPAGDDIPGELEAFITAARG